MPKGVAHTDKSKFEKRTVFGQTALFVVRIF